LKSGTYASKLDASLHTMAPPGRDQSAIKEGRLRGGGPLHVTERTRRLSSSTLADQAQAALAARFDPAAGRLSVPSPVAALLFLLDCARDGNEGALRLAVAALRRTSGDEQPRLRDAAAEAAVHVEAAEVAPGEGLEKTARAAVDAALNAFGWAGGEGGEQESPQAQGLMIATLARASVVLDAPGYREAASHAGARALDRRVDATSGGLPHSDGEKRPPAGVADDALLVRGLLELLVATGEKGWLHEAVQLQGQQDERLRPTAGQDGSDGDFVSGYGVAALNLIELARLTADGAYGERAEDLLSAFADDVTKEPLSHLTLLRAALRVDRPSPPG
jgi:hypothetical protein